MPRSFGRLATILSAASVLETDEPRRASVLNQVALHGGVVTAMLDESCGMAVELALDSTRAIATLDLRIDYQKPAIGGLDARAHSICTRVARSIGFVHSTAYQVSEDDPVMIGANRTNMLTDWPKEAFPVPTLEAP
jgi:uncharacterized protein (TIGR00369 family)